MASLDRAKLLLKAKYQLVHVPNQHKVAQWIEAVTTAIGDGMSPEHAGMKAARTVFPYEYRGQPAVGAASVEEIVADAGAGRGSDGDAEQKREIRKRVGAILGGLSPNAITSESEEIAARLSALPEWAHARGIFTYLSMPLEVSTDLIISRALQEGKLVAAPRVAGNDLEFVPIDPNADRSAYPRHQFGMRQPESGTAVEPKTLSTDSPILIVVPGVAFDLRGSRLGRGGGYYDRFLHRHRSRLFIVGVALSCQILASVPAGPMDIRVDLVVSGDRSIRFATEAAVSKKASKKL